MDGAGALRIAIIDGQTMFAETLRVWLATHAPDIHVQFLGSDCEAALADAAQLDVALLDVNSSAGTPDVVNRFAGKGVPVLLIGGPAVPARLREAFLAGAGGFVSKEADPHDLVARLHQVAAGEVVMSPELAAAMSGPGAAHLSRQEVCAVQLYTSGLTLKAVARQMSVSHHTAKEYLDRARGKYAAQGRIARTRAELRAVAQDDGLLSEQ